MKSADRAVAASAYVNSGHVQLTRFAHEKLVNYKGVLRNHFVYQVVAFGVGEESPDTGVLLTAFADGVLGAFAMSGYAAGPLDRQQSTSTTETHRCIPTNGP